MAEHDFTSSDSDSTSKEDEAETRVRRLMDRIFKRRETVKSEEDVNQMVTECSSMLEDMNFKSKKGEYKKSDSANRPRASRGGGDQASPERLAKRNSKKKPTETSTKEPDFLDQLIHSPAVKDLMKQKKEKPNFTDLYKQRVAEMMAKAPPSYVKDMSGKSKDNSWRKKIEALIEKESSDSLKSSDLSSDQSGLDPEEEEMFQKAMSAAYSGDQFDGRNMDNKDPKQFLLSKEDYKEAKKKAEEWLRAREPSLDSEGWNKMELEGISSKESSDSDDVPPTRKNLQKKTEDQLKTLKDKLAQFDTPKPTGETKKSSPLKTSSTHPAAAHKKITPSTSKPSSFLPTKLPSTNTRKTVKKT